VTSVILLSASRIILILTIPSGFRFRVQKDLSCCTISRKILTGWPLLSPAFLAVCQNHHSDPKYLTGRTGNACSYPPGLCPARFCPARFPVRPLSCTWPVRKSKRCCRPHRLSLHTPDQGTIFIQYTDRSAPKRDPVICANPVQPLIFRLLIQIAERYLKQRKAVGFIVLLYLRRIPFMICICFFS